MSLTSLFRLLFNFTLTAFAYIMASIIRRISKQADKVREESAPLDTDGARPQSGVYEKEWTNTVRELTDPVLKKELCHFGPIVDALKNASGKGLNDRDMLLEQMITIMAHTKEAEISKRLQQTAINLLYKDLPHPPSAYLSLPSPSTRTVSPEEQKRTYAFRSADGSNSSIVNPTMGLAGSPYARSVASQNLSAQKALPDPGLVFDTLLKRDKFEEHPGGISALFFAFADLVIHSIFNTHHFDGTINDTSSYLDLSILYGNSEAQVKAVRRNDGTGKLLDDVFADPRLLLMPPSSCALLILLNRNHNYVAQRLLDINENGNYKNPPPEDEKAKQEQDDELFHRSRLVNCGYFMKIILGDYVGAILGLVRDASDWRLDPLSTYRGLDHEFVPTGEGNVVSVEFNLLYRWHATLSQRDTEWTTEMIQGIFNGEEFKDITPEKFKVAAHQHLIPPANLQEWTFNNLKRDANHRFKDEDLAKILHDATESRAGAFKARGIPEALRVVEIMAITQSRKWGTCSLNEFRKFLGLKPYKTFEEWNPKKEIHTAAAALYKNIDSLELHVGLQAEEAKNPCPGAGLCPGYTISRAILADAVALTRGDRFMTVDFTPFNLTAWGYQDCQYDSKDGSYGGMLTKLLFRTLPNYYPKGSAYAHFPFLEPTYMKENLKKVDPSAFPKYAWNRPRPLSPSVTVDTFKEVQRVLADEGTYLSAYDGRLFTIVQPTLIKKMDKGTLRDKEKLRNGSDAASAKLVSGITELSKAIFAKPDANVSSYFAQKTAALIKQKAFLAADITYVDIVRDVVNLLPVYWLCEQVVGFPLKTETHLDGTLYDLQTYEKFAEIASYVYLNFDVADDWRLREQSQEHCAKFVEDAEKCLSERPLSWIAHFYASENNQSHTFLRRLWTRFGKGKSTTHEFAAQVVATVVPTAALYSQALATVVNYYLDNAQEAAREDIVKHANSKENDSLNKVMAYVYEALRLDPPVAGVYRTAAKDDVLGDIKVSAGTNLFASTVDAGRDISVFGPDPSVANYGRPLNDYNITNFGVDGLLTSDFFRATLPPVLGVIFSLKNLQRGPQQSGVFTRFVDDFHESPRTQYISQKGLVTQYPDSLIVQVSLPALLH
ncbi:heme peroxidase [Gymnopilus junonius]|uniref:Heme peroxidase n=1 Tax=Gymnopilus junonius TaxID=109634 RepID=A0A9P5NXS3_GYMJU|nr:heme peroxidase [Gymnopilus junonius]